ncbi:MAG: peptidylprolyl isomerase [Motiliproteus sp.]
MMVLAKIDEEVISSDDFVKILRFRADYEELVEPLLSDKLTVHAARKHGLTVTDEEVQERADQLRRLQGLHRAKEMMDYLADTGLTIEEYAEFVHEGLLKQKMVEEVCSDQAIEEYFRLHSPKFDTVEIRHIVVDSEGKAQELCALLEDDPDGFTDLAREHSLSSDTAAEGGLLGKLTRGTLPDDVDAKAFNAAAGDVLGPFESEDGLLFEIFQVTALHPARLDNNTRQTVHKQVYRQWLENRTQEHLIEIP